MFVRQPNGLFVEALGIELSALDASDLGGNHRSTVPEIFGAVLRPYLELLIVGHHCLPVPELLLGRCHVVTSRPCERSTKVVVSQLDIRRHRPEKALGLRCSFDSRCVVICVEPRLQLADPIAAGRICEMRIAFQVFYVLDNNFMAGGNGYQTTSVIPEANQFLPGAVPTDIAIGRDGSVWFLEFRGNRIGRWRDGKFSDFEVAKENAGLSGLTVAGDGTVWFGMVRSSSLGRLRALSLLPRP